MLVIAVVRVLVRHFKTDSNCGAAPTFATEQDKKHTCRRKAGLNDSIGPKTDPHVGSTTNKCLFSFSKVARIQRCRLAMFVMFNHFLMHTYQDL